MSRRGYLTLALAALAIAGVAVVRLVRPDRPPDHQQAQFEATRPALASLAYRDFDSEDDVDNALRKMEFIAPTQATEDQLDRLRSAVSQFLKLYYLAETPDQYVAWRQREGYAPRPIAAIDSEGWTIEDSRTVFLSAFTDGSEHSLELTGDPTHDFKEFWRVSLAAGRGRGRPAAIADEPAGLLTVLRRATASSRGWPLLEGELAKTAWYGGAAMGGRRWFEPPRSLDAILAEEGEALIAQTGIIFQHGDGMNRPLLQHYWEPRAQLWLMEGATVTNFPSREPTWPVEF